MPGRTSAKPRREADASDYVIVVAFQQLASSAWEPLVFFTASSSSEEARHGAIGWEILAAYWAIGNFFRALKGRYLFLFTDHHQRAHCILSLTIAVH